MTPEAPQQQTIPPDAKYKVRRLLVQAELSMLDETGMVKDDIITTPLIMHEAHFKEGVMSFLKSKGITPVED